MFGLGVGLRLVVGRRRADSFVLVVVSVLVFEVLLLSLKWLMDLA